MISSIGAAVLLLLIGIGVLAHPPYPSRTTHLMVIGFALLLVLAEQCSPQQRSTPLSSPPVPSTTDTTVEFAYTVDPTSGKYETECRRIFEQIYQRPFKKARPDWLKNPATRRNLEVDGICESLQPAIAFEYQGAQHAKLTTPFHRSPADLLYQQQKDQLKLQRCLERNVTLIVIPHTVKFDQLDTFIRTELTKHHRPVRCKQMKIVCKTVRDVTLARLNKVWQRTVTSCDIFHMHDSSVLKRKLTCMRPCFRWAIVRGR